jgi:hypothetical protein
MAILLVFATRYAVSVEKKNPMISWGAFRWGMCGCHPGEVKVMQSVSGWVPTQERGNDP